MKKTMKKLWLLAACFVFTGAVFSAELEPIAIIAPMPSESGYLKSQIDHLQSHTLAGMHYFSGTIAHKPVVLINSGIGKVDAAATATWLYCMLHPKLIILMGSSGDVNPKLKIGDVIVGDRVFDADYGQLTNDGPRMIGQISNPNRGTFVPTYFHPGKQFHALLERAVSASQKSFPKYQFEFGTIVTSDALPNPARQTKLFLANKVDVVAMEDAAVDKVGWLYRIPCINIRGVSNVAGVPQTNRATAVSARDAASVAVNFIKFF